VRTMFSVSGGRYSTPTPKSSPSYDGWGLEEQKLERLGAFEPEKIKVCKASQFRSDIEISARVGEENPGLTKLPGLPLYSTEATE